MPQPYSRGECPTNFISISYYKHIKKAIVQDYRAVVGLVHLAVVGVLVPTEEEKSYWYACLFGS